MTVYVCVTNAGSWGKSDNMSEAVQRAIRHAPDIATKGTVIHISCAKMTDEQILPLIAFNDQGQMTGPPGMTIAQDPTIDLEDIEYHWRRIGDILNNGF